MIDAFRDRDTRDELGIGVIRDGLSDLLFPGTTTIQTRARYFLFIPWIYRALEAARVPSSQIARRARAAELALVPPLAAEGGDGIIGINAGADLKRLASGVYWQGLAAWGLRRFPGSQDQYHRSLDAYYRRTAETRRNDDHEYFEATDANWHPGLPPPPSDFPGSASLQIQPEERDFLRDRVVLGHSESFLAFLIRREPWEPVDFAWQHPEAHLASAANRRQLHQARCFSETLHGAQLLYNLLLAQASSSLERIEHYRARLAEWRGEVVLRWEVLERWARHETTELWELLSRARVTPQTQVFVETYLSRLMDIGPSRIADDHDARELVHRREKSLKRKLARLENRTSLSMWGGAAGASQLDMRWGISQRLLLDILSPSESTDA